jgi:hypothetical protein
MVPRFSIRTILALTAAVAVVLCAKLFQADFRGLSSIKHDDVKYMVNVQLWADVPLLLVWVIATEWVLTRSAATMPGRRLVMVALTINLVWSLLGQYMVPSIFAYMMPKIGSFNLSILGTYLAYLIHTCTWSMVLIAFCQQCRAIERSPAVDS